MPRTPENLVRHELIGLDVTLADAADPGRDGLSGQVVDETRETLVVDTGDGEAVVPKDEARFRFALDDAQVAVEGELLVARPEERILKKFPRKWDTLTER
ncbi:MAG: ribonuclease P protein component 1 [Candidatus Nanohaloarchaea archaeon]|nr:ribonuclease P protein component 1 [Candidatus Nanohaloarchaea archaeon]